MSITVKETIGYAASLIGRNDLAAEAKTGEAPSGELLLLVRCFNLVENEVALDYIPLLKEESFLPVEGKIPFSSFSEAPVSVKKVTKSGIETAYDLFPSYLKVKGDGQTDIVYAYAPRAKELGDDSDFGGPVSVRLLALGVAAEFELAAGRFSEAASFDRMYREALACAGRVLRKLSLPARSWA